MKNKLSSSEIYAIMREGVEIAQHFMTDALPVSMIGMNNGLMCDYIEYIADRLLVTLKYKKIYNKKNPFNFMEVMGLTNKVSFFETRPHEYPDAHIMNKGNRVSVTMSTDGDW